MARFMLGFSFLLWGVAQAATLEEVVGRLEAAEKNVRSLRFDFVQETTVSVGGQSLTTQGRAFFLRPNRFRVEQSSPEKQHFISDGKNLWVHLLDRHQVLKDSLSHWARFSGFPQGLTPFQTKVAEMKKRYVFSLEETPEGPLLKLVPSKPGTFPYTLYLKVDMETGLVRKTRLSSETVTTVFSVQNPQVNASLNKELFQFVPPSGADLIEMSRALP